MQNIEKLSKVSATTLVNSLSLEVELFLMKDIFTAIHNVYLDVEGKMSSLEVISRLFVPNYKLSNEIKSDRKEA
jgi:hypothetical protein